MVLDELAPDRARSWQPEQRPSQSDRERMWAMLSFGIDVAGVTASPDLPAEAIYFTSTPTVAEQGN